MTNKKIKALNAQVEEMIADLRTLILEVESRNVIGVFDVRQFIIPEI